MSGGNLIPACVVSVLPSPCSVQTTKNYISKLYQHIFLTPNLIDMTINDMTPTKI